MVYGAERGQGTGYGGVWYVRVECFVLYFECMQIAEGGGEGGKGGKAFARSQSGDAARCSVAVRIHDDMADNWHNSAVVLLRMDGWEGVNCRGRGSLDDRFI